MIVASQSAVKQHPDYPQAKQGNVTDAAPAAKRLSGDLLTGSALDELRALRVQGARLVPVHALEGQGFNRIPAAFAELLGEKLHLEVETSIIQVNVVNHTGASGWMRLASPPLFEGPVLRGKATCWWTTSSVRAALWPTCVVTSCEAAALWLERFA